MGDKPDLNGKWSFHSQENFQEYLAENGEQFVDIIRLASKVPGEEGYLRGKCIPLLGQHSKTPTLSGTKFCDP